MSTRIRRATRQQEVASASASAPLTTSTSPSPSTSPPSSASTSCAVLREKAIDLLQKLIKKTSSDESENAPAVFVTLLSKLKQSDSPALIANAYQNIAILFFNKDKYKDAFSLLKNAAAIYRLAGDNEKYGKCVALQAKSGVSYARSVLSEEPEQAMMYLRQTIEVVERMDWSCCGSAKDALFELSCAYTLLGFHTWESSISGSMSSSIASISFEAIEFFNKALTVFAKLQPMLSEDESSSQFRNAISNLRTIADIYGMLDMIPHEAYTLHLLAGFLNSAVHLEFRISYAVALVQLAESYRALGFTSRATEAMAKAEAQMQADQVDQKGERKRSRSKSSSKVLDENASDGTTQRLKIIQYRMFRARYLVFSGQSGEVLDDVAELHELLEAATRSVDYYAVLALSYDVLSQIHFSHGNIADAIANAKTALNLRIRLLNSVSATKNQQLVSDTDCETTIPSSSDTTTSTSSTTTQDIGKKSTFSTAQALIAASSSRIEFTHTTRWRFIREVANALQVMGTLLEHVGVPRQAEYYFLKGVELGEHTKTLNSHSRFSLLLARLERKRNHFEKASELLEAIDTMLCSRLSANVSKQLSLFRSMILCDIHRFQGALKEASEYLDGNGHLLSDIVCTDYVRSLLNDPSIDMRTVIIADNPKDEKALVETGSSKQILQWLCQSSSKHLSPDACPSLVNLAYRIIRRSAEITCASGDVVSALNLLEQLLQKSEGEVSSNYPLDISKVLWAFGHCCTFQALEDMPRLLDIWVSHPLLPQSDPKPTSNRNRPKTGTQTGGLKMQAHPLPGSLLQARATLLNALGTCLRHAPPALMRRVCESLVMVWGRENQMLACFYANLALGVTARHEILLKFKEQETAPSKAQSLRICKDARSLSPLGTGASNDGSTGIDEIAEDMDKLDIATGREGGIRQSILQFDKNVDKEIDHFQQQVALLPPEWTVCSILLSSDSRYIIVSRVEAQRVVAFRLPVGTATVMSRTEGNQKEQAKARPSSSAPLSPSSPGTARRKGRMTRSRANRKVTSVQEETERDRAGNSAEVDCKATDNKAKTQPPDTLFNRLMQEFNTIMEESKQSTKNASSAQTEKEREQWWENRFVLDQRLQNNLLAIEDEWFGAWKGLLLGKLKDSCQQSALESAVDAALQRSMTVLQEHSSSVPQLHIDPDLLRILISSNNFLTQPQLELGVSWLLGWVNEPNQGLPQLTSEQADILSQLTEILRSEARKVFAAESTTPKGATDCQSNLRHTSSSSTSEKPLIRRHQSVIEDCEAEAKGVCSEDASLSPNCACRHPVILILSKELQHLPWESLSIISRDPVCRMPSWSIMIAHLHSWLTTHSLDAGVFQGFNSSRGYYFVNPSGDLTRTEEVICPRLSAVTSWNGLVAKAPTSAEFAGALEKHDIVVYCGHSSGEQYLKCDDVKKTRVRAVTLLMGCSSGVLKYDGEFEASGACTSYIIAGCPAVVANLWDVTDKDIDRFCLGLLDSGVVAPPPSSPCDTASNENISNDNNNDNHNKVLPLASAIPKARFACKLRYLVGAAPVYYGLPVQFC